MFNKLKTRAEKLDLKPLGQTLFSMNLNAKGSNAKQSSLSLKKRDEIQQFLNIRSKRKLVRFSGGKYQFKMIKNTNDNLMGMHQAT